MHFLATEIGCSGVLYLKYTIHFALGGGSSYAGLPRGDLFQ